MNDQLKENIEEIVDGIFKEREEAEMNKETEAALLQAATTITQLTASLEAKDVEKESAVAILQDTVSALEAQLNEIAEAKKALEDEKIQLTNEKTELIARAEKAETEISNMKKDQMAAARLQDLVVSGVSSTDKASQLLKIREMSDEDFVSYKTELVSIKDSIMAQLQAASNNTDTHTEVITDDTTATIEEAASDKRNLDPGQAIAAALNMEIKPNEDLVTKYRALGSELAKNIIADK